MKFNQGIPREELINEMILADIGICFIPTIKTYTVASPTKTIEYAVMGLPVLGNHLTDYDEYLSKNDSFLCDMDEMSIHKRINEILSLSREEITHRGLNLRAKVIARRSYATLSKKLFSFLYDL